MGKTTVVIADDHGMVRRGTREILQQDRDVTVVGEAANGMELIELVQSLRPQVVLVDIGMPDLNGIEATERIKDQWPEVGVVVLSVNDDDEYVWRAVQAGASGYLTKDVADSELISVVKKVAEGGAVLGDKATRAVLSRVRHAASSTAQPDASLTERELEVLRLVANGSSNHSIADQLSLSPRTIEVHLYHVFKKLGASSRTEAVVRATQRGLIEIQRG